jgi:membrane protease YdiL (CAAX protease family)
MNNKQKIAIISPLILIAIMYPAFQLLARALGERLGWYLGLVIYWVIWCAAFPLLMIGKDNIRKLIRPQKPNLKVLLLLALPLLLTCIYRFTTGMAYEKASLWSWLYLLSTPFGNGFFEEVLWRGVYMKLFHDKILYRIIWPSIWFAVWHYAPGSVSANSNVVGLMIGAGFLGFYSSYLAKKTDTIWWSIVVHTLGGIIIVV